MLEENARLRIQDELAVYAKSEEDFQFDFLPPYATEVGYEREGVKRYCTRLIPRILFLSIPRKEYPNGAKKILESLNPLTFMNTVLALDIPEEHCRTPYLNGTPLCLYKKIHSARGEFWRMLDKILDPAPAIRR